MTGNTPPAVVEFQRLFETGLGALSADHLAEEVRLRPPTYGKEWTGKALVGRLVTFAAEALGGLRYTDFWQSGDRFVLRFEGRIRELAISGVDIVMVDGDGRICEIEIFARPPKSVLMLREEMGVRVAADELTATAMGLNR